MTKPSTLTSFPSLADIKNPLMFSRLGRGLIGFGELLRAEFSGSNRFAEAQTWWNELCRQAIINDEVKQPGSGLVAFGAFTFAGDSKQKSVLIIPEKVIGIGKSGTFETTVEFSRRPGGSPKLSVSESRKSISQLEWAETDVTQSRFMSLVTMVKEEIQSGLLDKAVIARDLSSAIPEGFSAGAVLKRLTEAYPDTFVFSVDGSVGASPETLASVRDQTVSVRVLAGSSPRGMNEEDDLEKARVLATSQKDLDEHDFAVQNVIRTLQSCGVTALSEGNPFQLMLPNLWHLATDILGVLPESSSSLQIIKSLHPTAAVAGSPTEAALRFIELHEGLDRGRYAGPVGWVDAHGDGDWAIALRCAHIDRRSHTITAYAGAGIVRESDPAKELLETELKFQPIIQAVNEAVS